MMPKQQQKNMETKKFNSSLDPYALSQTFSFNGFVSSMLFSRWLCTIINPSCMSSNYIIL